jgi:hypothetical protein
VRPVLQADARARILIVGQAPGRRVHDTGVPFDDPSGERLREWMGVFGRGAAETQGAREAAAWRLTGSGPAALRRVRGQPHLTPEAAGRAQVNWTYLGESWQPNAPESSRGAFCEVLNHTAWRRRRLQRLVRLPYAGCVGGKR